MNNTYLVDSSIYIYRAWHVLPQTLLDKEGKVVNALLGFSDFVCEFMQQNQPQRIAFAFDHSLGKATRQAIYPLYKANRSPAPVDLKAQFMRCRELISLLGMAQTVSGRHEADDVLATWAKQEREEGRTVHVLSGDKDLTQLVVDEGDTWWDYARKRRWGAREVEKNWGVRPDQIADLLAIAGDKVDNIPGIPGVGAATAARLLRKFDSLTLLLENRFEIHKMKARGSQRLEDLVCAHVETITLARRLTGLVEDVDLPADISMIPMAPDWRQLRAFFEQSGFDAYRIRRWERVLG